MGAVADFFLAGSPKLNVIDKAMSSTMSLLGSPAKRMALGAVVGGIYGAATSESNIESNNLMAAGAGALAGLGLGFATTKYPYKGAWNAIGKGDALKNIPKHLWNAGIDTARLARGAINTAAGAPYITAGIGLGVAGMAGLASSGGIPNAGGLDSAAYAEQQGLPSSGMPPGFGGEEGAYGRQLFQQSANGLTFGLHNNRHS